MTKYSYEGPVVIFGTCVADRWKGETWAASESKAKSNLKYQFKKQNNRIVSNKIELPGKLIKKEHSYGNQIHTKQSQV